jgi:hypothetical protein
MTDIHRTCQNAVCATTHHPLAPGVDRSNKPFTRIECIESRETLHCDYNKMNKLDGILMLNMIDYKAGRYLSTNVSVEQVEKTALD